MHSPVSEEGLNKLREQLALARKRNRSQPPAQQRRPLATQTNTSGGRTSPQQPPTGGSYGSSVDVARHPFVPPQQTTSSEEFAAFEALAESGGSEVSSIAPAVAFSLPCGAASVGYESSAESELTIGPLTAQLVHVAAAASPRPGKAEKSAPPEDQPAPPAPAAEGKRRKLEGGARAGGARPAASSRVGAAGAPTNAALQAEVEALRRQARLAKAEKEAGLKERETLQKTVKQLNAAVASGGGDKSAGAVYRKLQAQQRKAAGMEKRADEAQANVERLAQSEQAAAAEVEVGRVQLDELSSEAIELRASLADTAQRLGAAEEGLTAGAAAAAEVAQLRSAHYTAEQALRAAAAEAAQWCSRHGEVAAELTTATATAAAAELQLERAATEIGSAAASAERLRSERAELKAAHAKTVADLGRSTALLAAATAQLDGLVAEAAAAFIIQRGWRQRQGRAGLRTVRSSFRVRLAAAGLRREEMVVGLEAQLEQLAAQLEAGQADRRASAGLSAQHSAELGAARDAQSAVQARLDNCEAGWRAQCERLTAQLEKAGMAAEQEGARHAEALAHSQRDTTKLRAELAAATSTLRQSEAYAHSSSRQVYGEREATDQLHQAEMVAVTQAADTAKAALGSARAEADKEALGRRQAHAELDRMRQTFDADAAAAGRQLGELRATVQELRAEVADAAAGQAAAVAQLEDTSREEQADAAYDSLRREWAAGQRDVSRLQEQLLEKDTKIAQLRTNTATTRSKGSKGIPGSPARRRGSPGRARSPALHADPTPASASRYSGSPEQRRGRSRSREHRSPSRNSDYSRSPSRGHCNPYGGRSPARERLPSSPGSSRGHSRPHCRDEEAAAVEGAHWRAASPQQYDHSYRPAYGEMRHGSGGGGHRHSMEASNSPKSRVDSGLHHGGQEALSPGRGAHSLGTTLDESAAPISAAEAKRRSERAHVERLAAGRKQKGEVEAYRAGAPQFLINAKKRAEAEAAVEMAAVFEELEPKAAAVRLAGSRQSSLRPKSHGRKAATSPKRGSNSVFRPGSRSNAAAAARAEPPRRCPQCRRGPISCTCDAPKSPWRGSGDRRKSSGGWHGGSGGGDELPLDDTTQSSGVFARLSGGAAFGPAQRSSRRSGAPVVGPVVVGPSRTRSGNSSYVF